ncbi:hypothetical protein HPB50_029097 [Hyalomma asiaticum]|nr:hypothetical protein HPB50_029097 [Hyalomma asiaticum]
MSERDAAVDRERRGALLHTKTPVVDSAELVADPTISNFSSQQREVDAPVGEKMEEDAVLNIYDDKTDDDAGGCWKTVMHKGRARQTREDATLRERLGQPGRLSAYQTQAQPEYELATASTAR